MQIMPFANPMSRSQTWLGWCYLPVHIFALPFILSAFAEFSQTPITQGRLNFIYYIISLAFVLVFLVRYLRRNFDTLCDRFALCLVIALSSILIYYALSYLAALILLLCEGGLADNPNNAQLVAISRKEFPMMSTISIFLAPLVEEVLFRGVVFGSMQKYSRFSAYVISIALFCIYHVWQYIYVSLDWTLLIYAVQYIPAGFVLARLYERTGTIWASIFFHMGVNAFSFAFMSQMM